MTVGMSCGARCGLASALADARVRISFKRPSVLYSQGLLCGRIVAATLLPTESLLSDLLHRDPSHLCRSLPFLV